MFSLAGERLRKGPLRGWKGAGQDNTPLQSAAGIPVLRCEGRPHVLGHPGRLPNGDSELLLSETRNGMTPCRKPHAVCTRGRDFLTASVSPTSHQQGQHNGRKDLRQKPRGVCTHGTNFLTSRGSGGIILSSIPQSVYTWGALFDKDAVQMRLHKGQRAAEEYPMSEITYRVYTRDGLSGMRSHRCMRGLPVSSGTHPPLLLP